MIKIICVGKIKEKYVKDAIAEYSKRISKYTKLEIIEVSDRDKLPIKDILDKEGNDILKHINDKDYVVTLEITHPDGTVTKENRDIVATIDRLNGYAHKYMKRGRYSVIGSGKPSFSVRPRQIVCPCKCREHYITYPQNSHTKTSQRCL